MKTSRNLLEQDLENMVAVEGQVFCVVRGICTTGPSSEDGGEGERSVAMVHWGCAVCIEATIGYILGMRSAYLRTFSAIVFLEELFSAIWFSLKQRNKKEASPERLDLHRLRLFENKVLRKIFGAKRDEVTGEWRKLHNTELHSLYSSPDIIRNLKSRRLRWAGHVARIGESRNAYRELVGRAEGKRPLGRPRRRWEDNIKMDLREVGYDGRDWINLAQDRDQWRAYVRAAMNLRVPLKPSNQASLVYQSSISKASATVVSIRGPEFECSGPQLEGPEFECSELSLKCAVSSTQKFLVQQHITTSKHQANKQLNSKQRQLFLTQPTTSNEFLEKYTQHTIPNESTLRKTYAPSIYDETIQKIRDEIKDSSIWVSIDETPDKEGRLVGNVVIGLLSEQYSERILLHCDVLEKCNNKTIVKLFNEAMGILWPKGIMYDNVLFFISDAAPYMVKAGQALSVVYPKLTHFTCVAHAFHRVAEVVRDNFLK
ncbi:hypothetical protein ANN_10616 [Periplaneta americana]|uniref:DUF659 domain-containing protein n=1 Tax=Periplaneta americana TaxID=6978 RepID=A0ABQ8TRD2_PERAM|nr:hypothetical protein ANN_10616 [Periplaneta americana]